MLLFALNFALGVSLQFGSRWHPRPLHHALYLLTCLSTVLALALAWKEGHSGTLLLLLVTLLLLVPRTHPGRADHALLATLIGALYVLTAWRLL
ncbi:hypothetical protein Deipe_1778 [Deinococcus peraridilitoris DSM 19664]|uniref:Uncharacterized protein n=2 Tax=Deinococcus TaxID=1298 RepID=L0A290_DEIPD|nr:hypothetical protein Deipe_1778 [Deinococcus peraridilitoris DSM 19664]